MASPAAGISRTGTQTVQRTVRVLKVIAARGRFGWRLSDLARHCQMSKGTMHRVLGGLARERLVLQRAADRHYLPGPLLFELGLALPSFSEFLGASQAPLRRIARKTGMVAYLFLRSGNDFVCASRQGTSELKALSIEIGTRRPLLSAAGGIAILVALEKAESGPVLEDNLREIGHFGPQRIRALQAVLKESCHRGFGLHKGQIVPGVHALGLAVHDPAGEPFASLSVVGEAAKLPPSRVPQVLSLVAREARIVSGAAHRLGVFGEAGASLPHKPL